MEATTSQTPDEFFLETFSGSELASSGLRFTVQIKAGCGKRGPRPAGDIKFEKNLKKYQKGYKNSGKYDWTDKCTVEIIWKWHHNVDFRSLYSQSMSTGGALYTYLPVEAMW